MLYLLCVVQPTVSIMINTQNIVNTTQQQRVKNWEFCCWVCEKDFDFLGQHDDALFTSRVWARRKKIPNIDLTCLLVE